MKKLIKSGVIMLVVATLVAANYFAVYWFTPYPRYVAWKKTPIESAELFDYPDQILLYADGKTKILTKEEDISEAYEAFWQLLGNKLRVNPRNNPKTPALNDKMAAKRRKESKICIEFRYSQRRTYLVNLGVTVPVKPEFDALVVLIPSMQMQQCLNGMYKHGPMQKGLAIRGSLDDFESYVYSLF